MSKSAPENPIEIGAIKAHALREAATDYKELKALGRRPDSRLSKKQRHKVSTFEMLTTPEWLERQARKIEGDEQAPTAAADNCTMIASLEQLRALPEGSTIWGSSHAQPDEPGSGAPYLKLRAEDCADSETQWHDYGNSFAVCAEDILLPAVLIRRGAH